MKRPIRVLMLGVAFFVSATCAVAQQRTAQIQGVGGDTCGEYVARQRLSAYEYMVHSWMQGYMAGYNAFAKSPQVKPPSIETLEAFIDKYCRDNPLATVAAMTDSLIQQLRERR